MTLANQKRGDPALSVNPQAKFTHHKVFDERVNHAAHMIGWYKVVQ